MGNDREADKLTGLQYHQGAYEDPASATTLTADPQIIRDGNTQPDRNDGNSPEEDSPGQRGPPVAVSMRFSARRVAPIREADLLPEEVADRAIGPRLLEGLHAGLRRFRVQHVQF